MDSYIIQLLVIGLLLLTVTLGSGLISRLPLSYALIYLFVGIALGPFGIGLIDIRPDAKFLMRLTEFVVLISLYSCGLKMNRPLQLWAWNSTARLIGFLMPISIFAIAAVGHFLLKMDWGPAILLGAILAPTDPVLASEVQVENVEDKDELRFGLTSEGGLNDAAAFPFVYFGIHSLEDPKWENWFKEWVAVDLIWATAAGIVMGIIVAHAVVWIDKKLKKHHPIDQSMEDFVALSTILLTYCLTELVNGYGFVAVFVAGIVAQRRYHDPEKQLAQLEFTQRIEKLMEVATILLLGSLLRFDRMYDFAAQAILVAGLLFFFIRPAGAWISTVGDRFHPAKRLLFGWFGIRGVGSLYYLCYAFGHGLKDPQLGEQIAWITYSTIVLSVILHGISSTPLMNWYERHIASRNEKGKAVAGVK